MNEIAAATFFLRNSKKIIAIAKEAYDSVDGNIKSSLGIAYDNYLNEIKLKYSKSKSFFTSNHPAELYDYYVGTDLEFERKTIKLADCDKLLMNSRHAVISGSGGCGKSVFLKHLILDSITNSEYVPIMIELREFNDSANSLDDAIADSLSKYNFNLSEKLIDKNKKNGGFILILDGYDEVNHNKRKTLIKGINKFIAKYPLCPIVISTRPDDVFKGIDEFTIYQVKPLTLPLAVDLINKISYDNDIKSKFIRALKESLFQTHHSFLSNPLLLSIMLLTYSENANIPKKLSLFYSQAFEALFHKHDASKGVYVRKMESELDIQDFSTLFSLFSLQTYDKRIFRMPRINCLEYIKKSSEISNIQSSPENYLSDLLSATCLLIEDGLEIAYSHRSFQEYFVALYISKASPNIQEKLIQKYSENFSSDQVLKLLYEINPSITEKYLFIPKLKKSIEKTGIKKKAGEIHAQRFISQHISTIEIISHDKHPSVHLTTNGNINDLQILHFIFKKFYTYRFLTDEEQKEVINKFGEKNKTISIKIKDLNGRSPIIKYFSTLENCWLGKSHIEKMNDILETLIKKQKNSEDNIYEILEL